MKKWEAPKLIVLVRAAPEHSLIIDCKGAPGAEGPQNADAQCYFASDGCITCTAWSNS